MCTTEDPTRPDLSVCMDGDCVGEVCTPLVIRRTAGEPCDENRGVMCDKFENLRCTGTCVEGTGATCTNDDHIWFYANCEPEPGLIVNGQCAKGDDCASGVCGVDQNCAAGLCPG
jgi:hypothetical protein